MKRPRTNEGTASALCFCMNAGSSPVMAGRPMVASSTQYQNVAAMALAAANGKRSSEWFHRKGPT